MHHTHLGREQKHITHTHTHTHAMDVGETYAMSVIQDASIINKGQV